MDFKPDDVRVLRRQALTYGLRRGLLHHEAEEFAQDVVEQHLKERKASFPQLFVDYIRKNVGDNRNGVPTRASYQHINVDQVEFLAAREETRDEYFEILQPLPRGRDWMVMNLIFLWGFHVHEVAEIAGYHPSRISQILNKNLKILEGK